MFTWKQKILVQPLIFVQNPRFPLSTFAFLENFSRYSLAFGCLVVWRTTTENVAKCYQIKMLIQITLFSCVLLFNLIAAIYQQTRVYYPFMRDFPFGGLQSAYRLFSLHLFQQLANRCGNPAICCFSKYYLKIKDNPNTSDNSGI